MTESEAYRAINWPVDGLPLSFVLPVSGSDRADWIAWRCSRCSGSGVSVPEVFETRCFCCGATVQQVNGPVA